jgi:hypothetical protein
MVTTNTVVIPQAKPLPRTTVTVFGYVTDKRKNKFGEEI